MNDKQTIDDKLPKTPVCGIKNNMPKHLNIDSYKCNDSRDCYYRVRCDGLEICDYESNNQTLKHIKEE